MKSIKMADTIEINVREKNGGWYVYKEYMDRGLIYSRVRLINHKYKSRELAQMAAESLKAKQ
jgi:hypothetical protein